jgi:hypothetical protein
MIALTLRMMSRRLVLLGAFVVAFLVAAVGARLLTGSHEGHVELDRIFEVGGAPLASAFLLLGWVIGRFPLIAVLVLTAGVFSRDRSEGWARLYYTRPISPLVFYARRFGLLMLLAFAWSALLMPAFDAILLGSWAGPTTLVLIAAYVLAYGSLAALLSVWTRHDAWVALLLAILAIVWHGLRAGGVLVGTPPGTAEVISVVLPPHGALFAIETAFAEMRAVPTDALVYVALYSMLMLVLAGISLVRRDV